VGCLLGGWISEKVGRIKVIALGAVWAIFGAALQTSAKNPDWMICGENYSTMMIENLAEHAQLVSSMELVLECSMSSFPFGHVSSPHF
jgi:MFS family permease